MSKKERRKWRSPSESLKKPQFYLTEREKKDPESSRIQKWLDLADRLFENNSDPTPSTA